MKRRDFLITSTLAALAMNDLYAFTEWSNSLPENGSKMPVLFIGHGSPMNAIEDNEFSRGWKSLAGKLPAPTAIVVISAHWETLGTKITTMEKPRTIHDFGGFPEKLFQQIYPAPGQPKLAAEIIDTVKSTAILPDEQWGLDHGTWSILLPMFPKADIPVIQLSLDRSKGPSYHFELAKELRSLRKKGVLIIGSGNIVHNLGRILWEDKAYDWAIEFDSKIKMAIDTNDSKTLINYTSLGKAALLSVPSNEHYLPLLYAAGLRDEKDKVSYFNDKTTMGAISMRSVMYHS
ncbi:MAG: 4,5-DOPA dioxygenase extradiol [Flavobacteriales bacterium]